MVTAVIIVSLVVEVASLAVMAVLVRNAPLEGEKS